MLYGMRLNVVQFHQMDWNHKCSNSSENVVLKSFLIQKTEQSSISVYLGTELLTFVQFSKTVWVLVRTFSQNRFVFFYTHFHTVFIFIYPNVCMGLGVHSLFVVCTVNTWCHHDVHQTTHHSCTKNMWHYRYMYFSSTTCSQVLHEVDLSPTVDRWFCTVCFSSSNNAPLLS